MDSSPLSRRDFLGGTLLAGAAALVGGEISPRYRLGSPALVTSERLRPWLPSGIQAGDVSATRGIVWSRTDRPARLLIEWATNDRFTDVRRVRGPVAGPGSAFTAALDLQGLPPGQRIVYRARFESLAHPGTFSEPLVGHFRTPSREPRAVRVAWGGDVAGQGWGIDRERGGMRMFETIRRAEPDVFIHSGDNIYADGPLLPEVRLDDGTVWRNLVTEAKSKPAETLDDFRGCYAYNLLDENVQRFGASVPVIAQWDDHEVLNNWYPTEILGASDPYAEKRVAVMAARAKRALYEFLPIRRPADPSRGVYRSYAHGPLLEIFVLDLRSHRGPNSTNRQAGIGPESRLLGGAQVAWLKQALRASRAVWKVIASDMPIGLVVGDALLDGERTYEAWANGDSGSPLGRELELADLLAFIRRERVRNTVWVTADVHYAAAHHYAPERARFTEFDPFWELVAGPLHAGNFGPSALDATFGPEVRFATAAAGIRSNRPPSDNLQYFGTLDIDPATRALTAGIHDVTGRRLWQTEIAPSA